MSCPKCGRDANELCEWVTADLERRLAQRTQERDNFRAVLSGEGYQNLDKIAAENRDCSQIGAEARRRTMEIIARADSAEAKLERIRVAAGKWKRTERYSEEAEMKHSWWKYIFWAVMLVPAIACVCFLWLFMLVLYGKKQANNLWKEFF